MIKKIIFHSKADQNYKDDRYLPQSVKQNIPSWYRKADKHKKKPDGLYLLEWFRKPDGKVDLHRVRSWKSCPAILDTFTTGYYLFTPCDITIKKVDGEYTVSLSEKWDASKNISQKIAKTHMGEALPWGASPTPEMSNSNPFLFCAIRGPESGFPTPPGYEDTHFFWTTQWFPKIPEGYTALFTHPLNRFDLDFLTISGFVDCESFNNAGRMPFFIKKGFEGVIPAGTPYTQIIPFKNEKWKSEIIDYSPEEIKNNYAKDNLNSYESEMPQHDEDSHYKQKFWLKKEYE